MNRTEQTMTRPLEVHEHAIISGDRASKTWCNRIVHSHEGGDQPHVHPDTGPACYTIDKDEWQAKTGMVGGGRKEFTKRPIGEQLSVIPKVPEPFEVIVCSAPGDNEGEGPGLDPVVRMNLAFKSRPVLRSVGR